MNAVPPIEWKRRAIRRLWSGIDITKVRAGLAAHPELWNQHRIRTKVYEHSQVADIWVRYNDWKNYDPARGLASFNQEHDASWYPAADVIPELRTMALDVMRQVEGVRLGGVLITRIPPGGKVQPHIDRGWHAEYYDKFAVQIQAAPGQAFHFEGEQLASKTGDIYTFDNSRTHWVTNDSEIERITMIVCVRLDHPGALLWTRE